jgi:aminoglycoside phosphotransferase (APT) family kinase protein
MCAHRPVDRSDRSRSGRGCIPTRWTPIRLSYVACSQPSSRSGQRFRSSRCPGVGRDNALSSWSPCSTSIPPAGPSPGRHNFFRGEPLANRDEPTRAAIASLGSAIDADAVTAAWEEALRVPAWEQAPVWIHGDLDARNLLVERGRLCAVIDFGCLGVGDPAGDVMVAWKILSAVARDIFRSQLWVDEATWERGRGWALSHALGALSYYTLETNPVLVREAGRWPKEVLADHATG